MAANLFVRLLKKVIQNEKLSIFYPAFEINTKRLLFHGEKFLSQSQHSNSSNIIYVEKDLDLVERIIMAYRAANKSNLGDSMWQTFFSSHHDVIHQALTDGNVDIVTQILRDPRTSDLFYGFDALTKSLYGNYNSKRVRNINAKVCLSGLVRFAESSGAIPIYNPEACSTDDVKPFDVENLLVAISEKCWPFSVPNPYPGEHGLGTSKGVISYRVPQALYQAWQIKQLVKDIENPRILEIGAGLGRTAYYAFELGLKDYTIVDIPMTSVSQAYFLGRTIGDENIHLDGEYSGESPQKIKIITPQTFMRGSKTYDLILNADSLTEMDISIAKGYWEKIKTSTNTFLSINHESNTYCVKDLIAEDLSNYAVSRYPHWMRNGYVEELVTKKVRY